MRDNDGLNLKQDYNLSNPPFELIKRFAREAKLIGNKSRPAVVSEQLQDSVRNILSLGYPEDPVGVALKDEKLKLYHLMNHLGWQHIYIGCEASKTLDKILTAKTYDVCDKAGFRLKDNSVDPLVFGLARFLLARFDYNVTQTAKRLPEFLDMRISDRYDRHVIGLD